jgi:hypothetical protein
MANRTTLAKVEQLAAELPSTQQLKLAARICERLSVAEPVSKETQRAHLAWLCACDRLANQIPGGFDAAHDLREMRDARA